MSAASKWRNGWRQRALPLVLGLAAAGSGVLAAGVVAPPVALKPPSAFSGIGNRDQRSLALFREMGKVIQSPRCLNCHPVGDNVTRGEAMIPHLPRIVRGEGGFGAAGMHCTTCHHAENSVAAGIPGNPAWRLAPPEMTWQGRTLGQICRQMLDPKRNGGRTLQQLVEHMTKDDLVGWGWHPGVDRRPAPGTQAQFGALAKAWADNGARCPL